MSDIQDKIKEIVNSSKVVLFMKGEPNFPACGFSSRAVAILKANGQKDYAYINVLEDMQVREGIKVFSQWPTIPQLYINGEFVGGSDIMAEMHETGELAELLKEVE